MVRVVLPLPRTIDSAAQQQRCGNANVRCGVCEPLSECAVDSQPESARPIVIRIPECGGLPDADHGQIVRGMLLLEVGVATAASQGVRCLDDTDAVDSSHMLRAETRPTRRIDDDVSQPPSSRVGRVGATRRPPAAEPRVYRRDVRGPYVGRGDDAELRVTRADAVEPLVTRADAAELCVTRREANLSAPTPPLANQAAVVPMKVRRSLVRIYIGVVLVLAFATLASLWLFMR
jgi:hypothetical protein